MEKLETTLSLLKKDNKILLGMKKRGFGEGKYNGVGGKLKENENTRTDFLDEDYVTENRNRLIKVQSRKRRY